MKNFIKLEEKLFNKGYNVLNYAQRGYELSTLEVEPLNKKEFEVYVDGYYQGDFYSQVLRFNVENTIDVALRYITNCGFTNKGAILMAKQIAENIGKVVNLTFAGEIVHSIEP